MKFSIKTVKLEILQNIRISIEDVYPILLSVLVLLACYRVHVFGTLWSVMLLLSAGMLLVEVLMRKYIFSQLAVVLCVFFAVSFVSTFINQEINVTMLRMYLMPVVYILWCDLYCKKHTRIFLRSHVVIVGILYLIQLYFQIADPEYFGLTDSNNYVNFVISDNFLGYYLVPFLTLVFVSCIRKHGKINLVSWLWMIACVYSVVISGAGACTLGVCFFSVMLIIVCSIGRKWLKVNIYLIYAVYLAFLIGIVVFSMQDFFADFLMNTIGKSTSLTGRIYIWARIPVYFAEHPWLGYGIGSEGTASVILVLEGGAYWVGEYWHAHNYFFEILICGGILQMIPYIISLWLVAKKIRRCEDNVTANIIKFGLLAMLIMYTSEGMILQPAQYLIYFLAYYSPVFAVPEGSVSLVKPKPQKRKYRLRITGPTVIR